MESSNILSLLKAKVSSSSSGNAEELVLSCEEFIQNLMFDGMRSERRFTQSVSTYVSAIGINFVRNTDSIAYVCIDSNKITLNVDAFNLINYVRNDSEVVFILAHEVHHIIYNHLQKYNDMYGETVVSVLLNLVTDVEINEELKKTMGNDCVPNSCFDIKDMARILDIDKDRLDTLVSRRVGRCKDGKYSTMADVLYVMLSKRFEKVLGYSILNVRYHLSLDSTLSFTDELYKVSEFKDSKLFKIEDRSVAAKFCSELVRYLKRTPNSMICMSPSSKDGKKSKDALKDFKSARGSLGKNKSNEKNCGSAQEKGVSGSKSNNIGDGNGSIGDGSVGIENKGISVSDGVNIEDIAVLCEDIVGLQNVLSDNMRNRSRSSSGNGSSVVVDLNDSVALVKWQNVLRNKLRSLSDEKVFTKKRINRRQPDRLELSGKKLKREVSLVVAIDESGSISNKEYSYFVKELLKVTSEFDCSLHLYEFTSVVESYTYLSSSKSKKLKNDSDVFRSRFCGGTCFQPVFDAIKDNSKIRNSESLVVIFTDGCGESEVDFNNINDRLWVVVKNSDGLDCSVSCEENERKIYPVVVL